MGNDSKLGSVAGEYPSPDRDAFPDGERVVNQACHSLRAKVQRAVKRRTGCRLTADEAFALDFMEGDGDWWNAIREAAPDPSPHRSKPS